MDGDVSRLRLLPCTGPRPRHRCRRQAAFFADACRLAREPAQEIQLGPAYPAFPHQPDLGDRRRVQREDPLDAHARGNLADGEGLVHAAAPPGNADALERLQALFLTLAHAHHDAHRVAGREGWNIVPQILHNYLLESPFFSHKSGLRSRVRRSACAARHAAILSWSPLNNTSGRSEEHTSELQSLA